MDEKRLAELSEISRKIRVGIIDAVDGAGRGKRGHAAQREDERQNERGEDPAPE